MSACPGIVHRLMIRFNYIFILFFRALHPLQPVPIVDKDLLEMLDAPKALKEAAAPHLANIKKLFPLEKVSKAAIDQLYHKLKTIPSTGTTANGDCSVNNSKGPVAPIDAKDESNLVEVGTVTPAEDFAELLRRGEKFATLCLQIQNVIGDLVFKTVVVQMEKCAMAIMMYREEARVLGAFRYNEWILEFKQMLLTRKKLNVWENIIVKERFGLISAEESETSTVSEAEVAEFYANIGDASASITHIIPDDDDVDELFGNM